MVHEDVYISSSGFLWEGELLTKSQIFLYRNNIFLIKEINDEIRTVKVIKSNGIILSFNRTYGEE